MAGETHLRSFQRVRNKRTGKGMPSKGEPEKAPRVMALQQTTQTRDKEGRSMILTGAIQNKNKTVFSRYAPGLAAANIHRRQKCTNGREHSRARAQKPRTHAAQMTPLRRYD